MTTLAPSTTPMDVHAPPPEYTPSEATEEPLDFDVKDLSATEKKELLDSASLDSRDSSSVAPIPSSFTPTRTLHVNSRGIRLLRLPVPSRELEIPIQTADGSLAYASTRQRVSSGNAILTSADGQELVASYYRFGPGRSPKLTLLTEPEGKNEIQVSSRWTSRTQEFVQTSVPIKFQWSYRKEKNAEGKKVGLLILTVGGKKKGEETRIAQLVRDETARTPNTKGCDAGNGGELQIDELAAQGLGVKEEVIVSTLIMMLKKEIDRRRAIQFMVIAAAVSN